MKRLRIARPWKKKHIDVRWSLSGNRLTAYIRFLFLRHVRFIAVAVLAIAFVVSSFLIVQLMFLGVDQGGQITSVEERTVAVAVIDELSQWIQKRQAAYENPPSFPSEMFQTEQEP